MALKFLYITQDPFINQSEEFVRILGQSSLLTSFAGSGASSTGLLQDPAGNSVMTFSAISQTLGTDSTAYPYLSQSFGQANQILIIPPGWSYRNFGRAIAVQGSLEEVLRVN